jgi:hypothetical protein
VTARPQGGPLPPLTCGRASRPPAGTK